MNIFIDIIKINIVLLIFLKKTKVFFYIRFLNLVKNVNQAKQNPIFINNNFIKLKLLIRIRNNFYDTEIDYNIKNIILKIELIRSYKNSIQC
jgi:hypothetical protein